MTPYEEARERLAKALAMADRYDMGGVQFGEGPEGFVSFEDIRAILSPEVGRGEEGEGSSRDHALTDCAALEEAIRICEVGEYLIETAAYCGGDGYSQPYEYSIGWDWQQSKPDQCHGKGVLLAEAVAWHKAQSADGLTTEAAKLRAALSSAKPPASESSRDEQNPLLRGGE